MVVPFYVKILVLLAIVGAIASGGFWKGYNVGYDAATADLNKSIQEMKESLDTVKTEFKTYKDEQEAKLRKIETDSVAAAAQAQANAEKFRKKADVSQSQYQKLLNDRKEVPSTLSSSSVDTINSLVNDWESVQ